MADEKALKEAQDALAAAEKAKGELEKENARLKEVVILGKARTFVSGKLTEAQIPDLTKTRLMEELSKKPIVKDGELDEGAMEKAITEAVKAEVEYLTKVLGKGSVEGLGESSGQSPEGDPKKLEEAFADYFEEKGVGHDGAVRMAHEAMR